ncbi:Mss4-like protein [Xylogone sp. PMI_703]|nr:Mss4-like protein [Xylogone sp. PMI_703]
MAEAKYIYGTCNCGKIKISIPKDSFPTSSMLCHCMNCRVAGGTLFSVNLATPVKAVSVTGTTKTYNDTGDSGKPVIRHFCGDCGSPIFSEAKLTPGVLYVKGSVFRKSGFELPPPNCEAWTRNCEKWESLTPGVPSML